MVYIPVTPDTISQIRRPYMMQISKRTLANAGAANIVSESVADPPSSTNTSTSGLPSSTSSPSTAATQTSVVPPSGGFISDTVSQASQDHNTRIVNIVVPVLFLLLALVISGMIFVWMRRHPESWRNFNFVGKKQEEETVKGERRAGEREEEARREDVVRSPRAKEDKV